MTELHGSTNLLDAWQEWLSEDFDPAAFDVKTANAALAWLRGNKK